jgi:hypothetical protein
MSNNTCKCRKWKWPSDEGVVLQMGGRVGGWPADRGFHHVCRRFESRRREAAQRRKPQQRHDPPGPLREPPSPAYIHTYVCIHDDTQLTCMNQAPLQSDDSPLPRRERLGRNTCCVNAGQRWLKVLCPARSLSVLIADVLLHVINMCVRSSTCPKTDWWGDCARAG